MGSRRFVFIAPMLLAAAFAGHLLNVLVLEPGLGFSSADDFYDADKLLPVIGHPVWTLGALYHLLTAVAVVVFAREQRPGRDVLKPYVRVLGIGAALMFVIVSLTNIVGLRELRASAELSAADMQAVNAAFIVFRTVVLNAAVLMLGGFLLLGNVARLVLASGTTGARYLGIAAGVAAVLVPVMPMAAPAMIVLICAWGTILGVVALRHKNP